MLTVMDFNRLRVFYVIYETRNIVRAAEKLHVTRSALSQHLKKLEKELKVQLFIRTNRNIMPTTQGDLLMETMRPFIKSLEQTVASLEQGKTKPIGLIRIGAPTEFSVHFLSNVITSFSKKFPSVYFQLELGIPPVLLDQLQQGKLDFAIIDAGDIFEKMYPVLTRPIEEESQALICSKTYFDRHFKKSTPPTYDRLQLCTYISHVPQATELKFWFKHHHRKIPSQLQLSLVTSNIQIQIKAVTQGIGLALLPLKLVEKQLHSGQLVEIPTSKSYYVNKIYLAQLPEKIATLTEKLFLDFFYNSLKMMANPRCRLDKAP